MKWQVDWHGENQNQEGEQSSLEKTQRGSWKQGGKASVGGLSEARPVPGPSTESHIAQVEAGVNQEDPYLARGSRQWPGKLNSNSKIRARTRRRTSPKGEIRRQESRELMSAVKERRVRMECSAKASRIRIVNSSVKLFSVTISCEDWLLVTIIYIHISSCDKKNTARARVILQEDTCFGFSPQN